MNDLPMSESSLREIIREALGELLREGGAERFSALAGRGSEASQRGTAPTDVFVQVRDDSEMTELVQRIVGLCADPQTRSALSTGSLRFRLVDSSDTVKGHAPQSPEPTVIEKGAVTEAVVRRAAKAGTRLLLGPRAVLTPLGRETARALGVAIEGAHR